MNEESGLLKSIFLLPGHSGEITTALFPRLSIKMAIVSKENISSLDEEWSATGIYLLINQEGDSKTRLYVGKSTEGITSRLKQHPRSGRDWWGKAVLVIDNSTYGFSSAQSGWLESELVETMIGAPGIICDNKNQPADRSLPPYEQEELKPIVRAVLSVLRTLGANPDTPDQGQVKKSKKKKSSYSDTTIKDLLDVNLLKTGSTLYCTWLNRSDKNETAEVMSDGRIKTKDGEIFTSPSSAAAHIRGGATNGWAFWGIKSGAGKTRTLADLREKLSLANEEQSS